MITLLASENGLTGLLLDKGKGAKQAYTSKRRESALLEAAKMELKEYFEGKRKTFKTPLSLKGSEFELAVWGRVREVPYGETRNYRWLTERVGWAEAYRAVGAALGRSPLPIFIPCHRVVRSDGGLGGYRWGLEAKSFLLRLEGARL